LNFNRTLTHKNDLGDLVDAVIQQYRLDEADPARAEKVVKNEAPAARPGPGAGPNVSSFRQLRAESLGGALEVGN